MALKPSRYLLIGKHLYRDASGAQVKIGYATRAARIFAINPAIATKLADGDLPTVPAAELERLSGLRAIVDAAEDELDSVIDSYRAGSADPGVRAFTIMPTSYCNMACEYCGQEHFKS